MLRHQCCKIPGDQPEEGTDGYGGKNFERKKVLRREWRSVYGCAEFKCTTHRGIINAGDSVVVFLGDHERSEVGRVAGSKEDGEQRPDVGHEPAGDTSRRVHVDGGSEQHCPDEPECTKQRELVFLITHTTTYLLAPVCLTY